MTHALIQRGVEPGEEQRPVSSPSHDVQSRQSSLPLLGGTVSTIYLSTQPRSPWRFPPPHLISPFGFERQFDQRLLAAVKHGQDAQGPAFQLTRLGQPYPAHGLTRLPVPVVGMDGRGHDQPLARGKRFDAIHAGGILALVLLRHPTHGQQFLPQTAIVDTGTRCVYGKVLLTEATQPFIPDPLHHGFTVAVSMQLSMTCRFLYTLVSPTTLRERARPPADRVWPSRA
jgi:hypothetical protein